MESILMWAVRITIFGGFIWLLVAIVTSDMVLR